MADVDKSSKTEPPTEKKLAESRSRGQFAKAPEIGMAATLLAALLVFVFWAPQNSLQIFSFTRYILENLNLIISQQEGATNILAESYTVLGFVVLPLLVACFFASLLAEGTQTGFSFTPKALEPKLDKLDPIKGTKRVFGLKSLKTFLIDFLKFCMIGVIVWVTILFFIDDPIFYAPISIKSILPFIYKLFLTFLVLLLIFMIFIAIINFLIKKKEHDDEMKMTKQEVKEERKSREVAPEVKSAQRKKAMELVLGQNLQDVSTADVVVTNPTHFAVALRYERGTDHAPVIVAKGEDLLARRIKSIAIEFDVPMIENKLVAQTLYSIGVVGQSIPIQLYQTIAEILAKVYKSHAYYFHRLKARRLLIKRQPKLSL